MSFCCSNGERVCKAFRNELNQRSPFQNVSENLLGDIFEQLSVFMKKKYPQKYGLKPNKIAIDIMQNPKRNIERYENQQKKLEANNQKSFRTSIKLIKQNSNQFRARQPSTNSRKSDQVARRSSGFSQTQNSENTEMYQLTNRTYSLPREVCELNQIQLAVIRQQNQSKFESFLQMKRINENTILQLNNTITQREQQNFKLKQTIKEFQAQIQTFKHLRIQNRQMKQQLASRKLSAQVMSQEIESLRITIQSLSKKIEELSTQNLRLNQSNTKILENIKNNNALKQQNIKLQLKIKELDQKLSQKQIKKTIQVTNSSQLEENDYHTILKYFGKSDLLPNYKDRENAAKIRNQILKMFPNSISEIKLLYSYQPRSNLHFNEFIQKKQNLFVLIELYNEIYIGGFAGQADENQDVQNTFLFSISLKREPIRLIAQEKIKRIDGESGFLNFGNSQIKIKARSNSLTCNVSGFCVKYFNGERRVSIDRFLGDEERSRNVKGYQIYQIFFQEIK